MYTHDLLYLQQEWETWLAPVYKQIQTTKLQHNVQNIKGENRFENGAHWQLSPVGCVKAMWHYATHSASKQKRCLLRFPGY